MKNFYNVSGACKKYSDLNLRIKRNLRNLLRYNLNKI
jgi:hypothetical protein